MPAVLGLIALLAPLPMFAAGVGDPSPNPAAEPAAVAPVAPQLLETGFSDLYKLNFQGAREKFLTYQRMDPADPMGKAAEAASYLYQEFNEKGVFTSAFFLDDDKFLGGVPGKASENRNDQFLGVNEQARQMAQDILKSNPQDPHGLLVLTMTDGMESDYDALIEKKQLAGLSMMRRAEAEANTLLAIDPTANDAYLALGASNYVIGSLPAYKRFFLKMGGVHGDKQRGIEEMQQAAENGHYLKPFAKILLALGYEREHQPERARVLLAELCSQFPENPLYAHELSLVDQPKKQ
ncbi:MAG TPA: hypothetical protein VG322_10750 [Candidatus Acidoferrales bacterium]|nr:hypothetical protein [Candidatus Acidoferrales bacterium]